jgi:hypothetical protein
MSKTDEVVARFMRRAEKLRSIACNVKDRDIRDAMLVWAADYDRLAERAIQLPSSVAIKNRLRGAPSVRIHTALPAGERTSDLVHSKDRRSATARWRSPERRWPVVIHRLGYGLTAALAVAVIAHVLNGKPGHIP